MNLMHVQHGLLVPGPLEPHQRLIEALGQPRRTLDIGDGEVVHRLGAVEHSSSLKVSHGARDVGGCLGKLQPAEVVRCVALARTRLLFPQPLVDWRALSLIRLLANMKQQNVLSCATIGQFITIDTGDDDMFLIPNHFQVLESLRD